MMPHNRHERSTESALWGLYYLCLSGVATALFMNLYALYEALSAEGEGPSAWRILWIVLMITIDWWIVMRMRRTAPDQP